MVSGALGRGQGRVALVFRRSDMSKRALAYLAGGAAALVWMVSAAVHAAPVGVAKGIANQTTAVEQVVVRHNGNHAAKGPQVHGYTGHGASSKSELPFTYGMKQPEEYPVGSPSWWNSMKSTGHIE
jgi:hypothetical protein